MISSPQTPWPTKRIRFATKRTMSDKHRLLLSQASNVTFLPMTAIGEQGGLDLSAVRDIEEVNSGYTQVFDGDVVIAKITPCFENGKGALVSGMLGGVGFGTTELHVLTPSSDLDGRFLYFITVSTPFRQLGEACMTGAAGQKRVPEEFVSNYRIPVPPIEQQRAIAAYLDRETSRLDALVATKERMLGLLAEKRRTLITHAVTHGLEGTKTKEPEHQYRLAAITGRAGHGSDAEGRVNHAAAWGDDRVSRQASTFFPTKRLKHVVSLRRSRIVGSEHDSPYVGLENIESWTGKHLGNLAITANVQDTSLSNTFESGDVLLGKLRPYLAKVWVAEFAGRSTAEFLVMKPIQVEARFLRYVCLWRDFVETVDASTFGSKMPRADWNFIGNMLIPVPTLQIQRAIADFLDQATARLDALSFATKRTIELLKERRTALIAAAVTGQIDAEQAA